MTEQKKITPKPGMIVPLPDGNGNLPAEGKVVALTSYWYRRQSDGDVTIEDVPAIAAEATPAAPETPKAKGK